jgi:hypothetical protein
MSKNFSLHEVGDKITIKDGKGYGDLFGLVSFIDIELQTMSILVGRGCHRSEDTIRVVRSFDCSEVVLGWSDHEVAEKQLTPRPCPWYSDKEKPDK